MRRPAARTVVIVLAIVAAMSLVTGLAWRPSIVSRLGLAGHARYLGYVEGETSLIAPPVAGRLIERPVERGGQVKKGDRLFTIDPVLAQAEVARGEAALAESRSRYENLLTGKRQAEKEVTAAQHRETEAALAQAETEFKRQSELLARGVATRKEYEQAESQARQLRSRTASLAAQEKVNELAARPDEIEAAGSLVEQNQASLDQAKKRLDDVMPGAPEDAQVENTFFNPGEWVPAGTPVVSLLAPARVKLRFFVPEEDMAAVRIGQQVSFTCDNCRADLKATVIYVSPRAEFTPPVIYSQTARTKLVFLIEARPDPGQAKLSPGLPVSVAPFTP
jgi:HlyD family secretion protein